MTSYIPSTIQDKINSLMTQITNVYKAFIQLTQTFNVDSTSNATIKSNGDINLQPNSGNITVDSTQNITVSTSNELTIGTTFNNDMNIISGGNLSIGSSNNVINLLNSDEHKLGFIWGYDIPEITNYSIGSVYIDYNNGDLYIYKTDGWKKFNHN